MVHPFSAALALPLVAAFLTGCGSPVAPTATPVVTVAPTSTPAIAIPSPLPSETFAVPETGFAFDAESVLLYYESIGYACSEPAPSTEAQGYIHRSCELTDPDGRLRVIGVVTDPNGDVADGYASIRARPGEALPDPEAALEPLAGFLGAMLGEARGSALVPWLAGHLGDEFAETTAADLHVATYVGDDSGEAVLVVEVANDAFLESPRPSPS